MHIDVPVVNLPRVVIVGGGFAGLELAKKLRNRFQVVLIDKNNYHTFQPLLYQVATAGIEPDSIVYPLRKIFKGYKNFHFRMAAATGIVPGENLLKTSIGDLHFDHLVIATGSNTNYFGMEKLRDYSMPMKGVNEALDLRSCILQNFEEALLTSDPAERDALMTFVIAGGGPTGVELAGALGELKKHVLPKDYPELDFRRMQIHLIESAPRVLATMGEKASAHSQEFLKQLGVQVHTKTLVKDYDGRNVTTDPIKDLRTATLIWTAGVVGVNIPGLPEGAIHRSGRIVVDQYNLVQGTKNVYAIGDVAYMETKDSPKGHPMVAQVAIQQGRNVGKNLVFAQKEKPLRPFYYHDKGSMATIGRNRAVVESPFVTTNGFFAWLIWMFVHLMSLVGFRNRVVVLFNWLVNYISYDRGIRLIIRPFIPKSHRT